MTTIALAARAAFWRRPLALVRKAVAALRARRAAVRERESASRMHVERAVAHRAACGVSYVRGAHRAPKVRRQAAARAPRGPRHTVRPGCVRPAGPVTGAYRRGHSWRGRETLFTLTQGRVGMCPA